MVTFIELSEFQFFLCIFTIVEQIISFYPLINITYHITGSINYMLV